MMWQLRADNVEVPKHAEQQNRIDLTMVVRNLRGTINKYESHYSSVIVQTRAHSSINTSMNHINRVLYYKPEHIHLLIQV